MKFRRESVVIFTGFFCLLHLYLNLNGWYGEICFPVYSKCIHNISSELLLKSDIVLPAIKKYLRKDMQAENSYEAANTKLNLERGSFFEILERKHSSLHWIFLFVAFVSELKWLKSS